MSKRALILQHLSDDGPGRFGDLLSKDGFAIDTVHVHDGQDVPDLGRYDLMFALGGAMEVWEEAEHPWLVAEKEAIREWVGKRAKPFIGICLGHQLLADAMGGSVVKAEHKEVGLHEITYQGPEGHPFSDGLSGTHKVMQWHLSRVDRLPEGGTVLASSDTTDVQMMAVGEHALSVQFHFEWTLDGIKGWEGGWLRALQRELGDDAHPSVIRDAERHMPAIGEMTETIYRNFKRANGIS